MAYPPATLPGETGRTPRTTATGHPFVDIAVTINGDKCRIHIPANYEAPAEPVVFINPHGHGGTELTMDGAQTTPRREHYLSEGHIWGASQAQGNAWGNDASQQAYVDLANYIDANICTSTHHVLHGGSMGGLIAALIYANDLLPKARCAVIVDGALNLAWCHTRGSYQTAIRAAYGIASDGADFAAKTAGHNAATLPGATWAGKRLQVSASYADTAIWKAQNTDPFIASAGSSPDVLDAFETNGGHVVAENFPLVPFVAFVDAALAGDPPPGPGPTTVYLPTGIVGVEAYLVVDGVPVRVG